MPTHPTTELSSNDGSALVDPNVVLATAKGVLNDALHLEKITFAHEPRNTPTPNPWPADAGTLGPWMQYDILILARPPRFQAGRPLSRTPGSPVHCMSFDAYLFDYNGVLVDDERVHLDAFREVLAERGISISEQAYWERYLGLDDVGAVSALLAEHGQAATESVVRELVDRKKDAYSRRAQTGLRVFDGAGKLLCDLAGSGAIVGIVSGALRDEINLGLGHLDARAAIRFVIAAEDAPRCKPDPQGYLLGMKSVVNLRGPVAPERCLVIEDSLAGSQAARCAGLPCLAVEHSSAADALLRAGANRTVPRLSDIDDSVLADLARSIHVETS
jgi:beta-phosphoglucomutase